MREVTQDEFYERIGRGENVSSIIGNYPYTSEFYPRNNRYDVIGKVVGYFPDGSSLAARKYFLK